jgi:hypothetical protein
VLNPNKKRRRVKQRLRKRFLILKKEICCWELKAVQ